MQFSRHQGSQTLPLRRVDRRHVDHHCTHTSTSHAKHFQYNLNSNLRKSMYYERSTYSRNGWLESQPFSDQPPLHKLATLPMLPSVIQLSLTRMGSHIWYTYRVFRKWLTLKTLDFYHNEIALKVSKHKKYILTRYINLYRKLLYQTYLFILTRQLYFLFIEYTF